MCFFRKDLLCQLLRNSRSTTSILLAHHSSFYNSTPKGYKVNSRMFIKTFIFRSYKGMNKMWRKTIVTYSNTVSIILVPCANKLLIRGINLRGKLIYRVGKFVHIRHITYPAVPHGDKENKYCAHNSNK